MLKRTKAGFLTALAIILLLTTPAFTQSYSRTITAWFNNLTVQVDGETLLLENEPFIYNDTIYMPVEELADQLYMNFGYDQNTGVIQIQSNRLKITDPDSSVAPVAFQKNYLLESLERKVAELETELALLKGTSIPYQKIASFSELTKYIEENFGTLSGINMNVRLRQVGTSQYRLEAYFTGAGLGEWTKLSRRQIEAWADDIFYAIRELYDSNAVISGDVRYRNYTGTQYASYWTRGDSLYYDFRLAEHKENIYVDGTKIESSLKSRLSRYSNATFSYEVFVSQYDIDVVVYYSKGVDSWAPKTKMQYLRRLKTEIARVYDTVDISGRLIPDGKTDPTLRFSFEGDMIYSSDLMDELETYLDKNYKDFRSFDFTYRIYDGYDDVIKVDLIGDFAVTDSDWQSVENSSSRTEEFRRFIQTAYRYIEDLWDVDMFGEVLDKNGEVVTNVDFHSGSGSNRTRTVQPLSY